MTDRTADPAAQWTAILLAGQRPGIDPLAAHFGIAAKALVPIAGRPMLAHVLETLLAVDAIGRILVLAQDAEALVAATGIADPRIATAASGKGISTSIAAVAGGESAPWPLFVTTADHPLLTPEMIRFFLAAAPGTDVSVGVVGRRTLLAAYPESRRTWLRFSDDAFTGANLFALSTPAAARGLAAWSEVERDRKKAWTLIRHFGLGLAIRAVTRTISLAGAMARAAKALGFTARPVALPFAEAAIDVDKPLDHTQAEAILVARQSVG
ncbi:NTP transferase domain-containing protein [Sphingomonas naphthae]|uniref:NTP transferase domain-containing protein n=1 Tax=Sphingomonas naphthae TaxID=1813468 RepID=A0ABY7TIH7_9SPHN|nr:NTP transferase domain-containing protein [Sphingomonas naphthae]WCT72786.1 NTP transferase domain-containing protein [Sphingomonas naphthae]